MPSAKGKGFCTKNPCLRPNLTSGNDADLKNILVSFILEKIHKQVSMLHEIIVSELYIIKNQCYNTYTQGHCASPEEIAVFVGTLPIPKCFTLKEYFKGVDNFCHCCNFGPPTGPNVQYLNLDNEVTTNFPFYNQGQDF